MEWLNQSQTNDSNSRQSQIPKFTHYGNENFCDGDQNESTQNYLDEPEDRITPSSVIVVVRLLVLVAQHE